MNIKASPKKGKEGFVILLTGMSGSGKSTISTALKERLEKQGIEAQIIDGNTLREKTKGKEAYSKKSFSRREILKGNRLAIKIAKEQAEKGNAVLIAMIMPFKEARQLARKDIASYAEVFVNCPSKVCRERDTRGLYRKREAGEEAFIFGENMPYEKPEKADLELNTGKESAEESTEKVMQMLEKKGFCKA